MGKQYNKVEKRRRRIGYIKRKRMQAKAKKPHVAATTADTSPTPPAEPA